MLVNCLAIESKLNGRNSSFHINENRNIKIVFLPFSTIINAQCANLHNDMAPPVHKNSSDIYFGLLVIARRTFLLLRGTNRGGPLPTFVIVPSKKTRNNHDMFGIFV